MESDTIARILELYAEIERQCLSFQLASGLRCLDGCGSCCRSLKVESTPVEMLPAASELRQRGELEAWHERLAAGQYDSHKCVFYSTEPLFPSNGHCIMYAQRPTVCRLFGFAAVIKKNGLIEFGACRQVKTAHPDLLVHIREKINKGLNVPILSRYAMQVFGLEGIGENRLIPINQALRLAVARVAMSADLTRRAQGRDPGGFVGTDNFSTKAA
jgi:Fe-S-cluster containining protein